MRNDRRKCQRPKRQPKGTSTRSKPAAPISEAATRGAAESRRRPRSPTIAKSATLAPFLAGNTCLSGGDQRLLPRQIVLDEAFDDLRETGIGPDAERFGTAAVDA